MTRVATVFHYTILGDFVCGFWKVDSTALLYTIFLLHLELLKPPIEKQGIFIKNKEKVKTDSGQSTSKGYRGESQK
jgi:hypothetical protein